MSALAFAIVALLLVGPVPALLARAAWPLRAPRAAIVLWQSIAVAAVLSAFSAGLAIASRLFVPGPDGSNVPTCAYNVLYREKDGRFIDAETLSRLARARTPARMETP